MNDEREQTLRPRARQIGLQTQAVGNQLVIYDQRQKRLHTLNQTAAVVWRHCDGRHTVADLVALVNRELGTAADESVIWLAMAELTEARLLAEQAAPTAFAGLSRRTLFQRTAAVAAGLVLPAVATIGSPLSAAAQTTDGDDDDDDDDDDGGTTPPTGGGDDDDDDDDGGGTTTPPTTTAPPTTEVPTTAPPTTTPPTGGTTTPPTGGDDDDDDDDDDDGTTTPPTGGVTTPPTGDDDDGDDDDDGGTTTPAPNGTTPAPNGTTPAPNGTTPAPNGTTPPTAGVTSPPTGGTTTPGTGGTTTPRTAVGGVTAPPVVSNLPSSGVGTAVGSESNPGPALALLGAAAVLGRTLMRRIRSTETE